MFSIRQVKSGRRLGAKQNIKDITSEYCQLNKGFAVQRLDHYDEENAGWQEIVVEDKTSGPAEIAATRIDFAAWLQTLSKKEREIAITLSTGETTGRTARKFGLSASRVSQLRRQFKEAWEEFQGEWARPAAAVGEVV